MNLRAYEAKVADKLFVAFNEWFTSRGGVWQTLLVTALIVVAERVWPAFDPHGFYLLYWLTVYSAVTQPALAHAGKVSALHNETMLKHLEELLAMTNRVEQQVTP